jgi:Protein of unknown function (DUF3168)
MSASALALQQAIYAALVANAPLTAALGGVSVYDDPPQPLKFPYISFGPASVRDDDTATERSDEHSITLFVWSRAHGRKESHTLVDLVRSALHNQTLPLSAHRLINLQHEQTDTRRLPDGETTQATLRLRAVTEPI